ncbi:NAD(P)-dependent dehydrogenase (short-subunit alcohol dehydrogenase family) [Microbacterium thalassium]|uniref:NAD(P)-dependent dehydrogenase (Short-subunit alcohol dehydrogenase family) n=1 Tax=Microbacterium thalassium TaxID=362649 RepID=A0A7X0KT56_9MICO|nr:NAD(P)-dependent dehydrogenase (short-subunit alcohol dehydrogenase family) [Microbacterium thalassium]
MLVTGAGSADGIGFASARLVGAAGRNVVVTSTTDRIFERAEQLRADGIAAVGIVADLTSAEGVDAVISGAHREFGDIHVLVNNAGMTSVTDPDHPAPIGELSLEQWRASLDRNLTTAFRMVRAVLPQMHAARFGRIVNVSSVSGPVAAYPGDVAYHAAKAGLVGFTRALAIDTAAAGITVNASHPAGSTRGPPPTTSAKWGVLRLSDDQALRKKSHTRSPFSLRRRPRTSPARSSWWTAPTRSPRSGAYDRSGHDGHLPARGAAIRTHTRKPPFYRGFFCGDRGI